MQFDRRRWQVSLHSRHRAKQTDRECPSEFLIANDFLPAGTARDEPRPFRSGSPIAGFNIATMLLINDKGERETIAGLSPIEFTIG